jgi:hypothetical protein
MGLGSAEIYGTPSCGWCYSTGRCVPTLLMQLRHVNRMRSQAVCRQELRRKPRYRAALNLMRLHRSIANKPCNAAVVATGVCSDSSNEDDRCNRTGNER